MFPSKYTPLLLCLVINFTFHQSTAMSQREKAEQSHYDSVVIVPDSSDFMQTLLDSDLSALSDYELSQGRKFFQSFTHFGLVLNLRDDNDIKLLRRAAEYNRKYFGNSSSELSLKIWVIIKPRQNFSENVTPFFNLINESNEIYKGTVPTIFLSYSSIEPTLEYFSLMNSHAKKLRQEESTRKLNIGFSLTMRYCLESGHHLKTTLMDNWDFALFTSYRLYPLENKEDLLAELMSSFSCLKQINGNIPVVLAVPLQLEIDMNSADLYDKTLVTDLKEFSSGPNLYNVPVMIYSQFVEQKSKPEAINFIFKYEGFSKWLGVLPKFNKRNLGISGNFEHLPFNLSVVMPTICKSFSKIILKASKNIGNVVREISKYSKTSAELTIVMEILRDRGIENQVLIDNLLFTAHDSNATIKAIVYDFLQCAKSVPEADLTDSSQVEIYLRKWSNCADHQMISYSRGKMQGSGIKIGIVLDLEFLSTFAGLTYLTYGAKLLGLTHFNSTFDMVDIIVVKIMMPNGFLFEWGALATSVQVINKFRQSKALFKAIHENSSLEIVAYVSYSGCIGNGTNITHLSEYVRWVEIMNNWSVAENITVFVDTSLEIPNEECELMTSSDLPGSINCPCGWWLARKSISTTGTARYEFENKKAYAKRLYENMNKMNKTYSSTENYENSSSLYPILIPAIIFIILVSAAVPVVVYRCHPKDMLTKRQVKQFFNGQNLNSLENLEDGHENSLNQKYNKDKYELPRSAFKIDYTRPIGCGEFGMVFNGTISRYNVDTSVAVKTMKINANRESYSYFLALTALISEIKILSYCGEHKNIVRLLGAYTAKLRKGEIFVFLEFCELGSLYKHLRSSYKLDSATDNNGMSNEYVGNLVKENWVLKDLFQWVKEITCGMEFLASKKIVHADLATRNVLLTSSKSAKICDFGLSRRLYDYSEYLKTEAGPLPWRWMAPESLRKLVFNEKSDVWSFGITLWEIFSFGDEPYPGLSWDINFPTCLERGLRLQQPKDCDEQMFLIMTQCCNIDPGMRPTFSEIRNLLC